MSRRHSPKPPHYIVVREGIHRLYLMGWVETDDGLQHPQFTTVQEYGTQYASIKTTLRYQAKLISMGYKAYIKQGEIT